MLRPQLCCWRRLEHGQLAGVAGPLHSAVSLPSPPVQVNDFALLLLDRPATSRPLLRLPDGRVRCFCEARMPSVCRKAFFPPVPCWSVCLHTHPPTPHPVPTAAAAALPRPAAAPGTQLTVMGWGLDAKFDSDGFPTEFLPPVLKEVSRMFV